MDLLEKNGTLHSSFTLLELIVYLTLFSFFSILVFTFFHLTYQHLDFQKRLMVKILKSELALDLIRRDLMAASINVKEWDWDKFVFVKEKLEKEGALVRACVGWQVRKGGLRRYEGVYNFSARSWIKRAVSMWGCDINKIELVPVYDRNLSRVVAAYVAYQEGCQGTLKDMKRQCVVLRNRVIEG